MKDGLPLPRRYGAIGALCCGTALIIIDGGIANVALPSIARDLHVEFELGRVDRHDLSADAGDAVAALRRAGRADRAQADVPDGPADLHRRHVAVLFRQQPALPAGRPRRASDRRGGRAQRIVGADPLDLSGEATRPRARHQFGDRIELRGRRADDRRAGAGGRALALGVRLRGAVRRCSACCSAARCPIRRRATAFRSCSARSCARRCSASSSAARKARCTATARSCRRRSCWRARRSAIISSGASGARQTRSCRSTCFHARCSRCRRSARTPRSSRR